MKKIFLFFLVTIISVSAHAGIIFSDNFDSEAGGAGISQLDYNSFTQWTVSEGTVDVVSSGGWGIDCVGNTGKCIDLDGSSGNAGKLTSNNINLLAGDYTLSFDISGNQRNHNPDEMVVSLSGFIADSISLNANAPWQTQSYSFSVLSDQMNNISFNHNGGDNIGIMLDNVILATRDINAQTIDEPTTLALLGLTLIGIVIQRRKK